MPQFERRVANSPVNIDHLDLAESEFSVDIIQRPPIIFEYEDRLADAGFKFKSKPPAPMLKRSADIKAVIDKTEHRDKPNCNFSVGEPAVDAKILAKIDDVLNPPTPNALTVAHTSRGELKIPPATVKEIKEWAKKISANMTKYSPKPGDKKLRESFKKNEGAGHFSDNEHTVITGGHHPVISTIDAMIAETMAVQNKKLEVFEVNRDNFGKVKTEIEKARRRRSYIRLSVSDSSTLDDNQRQYIINRASRGRMVVVDLISDKLNQEKSLGLNKVIKEFVITVTDKPINKLTGVYGLFANPRFISYIMERNTNVRGTPSAEMHFHQQLAEFASWEKLVGLLTLTDEDLKSQGGMIPNLIRLFQHAATALYLQNEQVGQIPALQVRYSLTDRDRITAETVKIKATEAYMNLVNSQLEKLDSQTETLMRKLGFLTDKQHVVWDNGGARGANDQEMAYIEQKYGTKKWGVAAPCWSFGDLEVGVRKMDMIQAFTPEGTDSDKIITWIREPDNHNSGLIITWGPINPLEFTLTAAEMTKILEEARKNQVHVIIDATYLFYLNKTEEDSVKLNKQMSDIFDTSDVLVNFSASKNLLSPMLRSAAAITGNPESLRYFRNSPTRKSNQVQPFATLLLAAMTEKPDNLFGALADFPQSDQKGLIDLMRELAQRRARIFQEVTSERNDGPNQSFSRYSTIHGDFYKGGYYQTVFIDALKHLTKEQRDRFFDLLIPNERTAFLSLVDDLNADEKVWDGAFRMALVTPSTATDADFRDTVNYMYDSIEATLNKMRLH